MATEQESEVSEAVGKINPETITLDVELSETQVLKYYQLLQEVPKEELHRTMCTGARDELDGVYENEDDYISALEELGRLDGGDE